MNHADLDFKPRGAIRQLVLNGAAAPPKKQSKLGFTLLRKITINLKGVKVRHEEMAGKKYLVVPMVMMTDGVHHGSMGPLHYPGEEFSPDPVVMSWNHKPIVIYHPTTNGTACTPEIVTSQGVGVVMNTQAVQYEEQDSTDKGKKHKRMKWNAEAWLDEERLKAVDERVYTKIKNGEMIEVSTGLFCESDGEEGTWNGEPFEGTVRNYRADHLAILPDQKGACSIADGAGLLRNEASFDAKKVLLDTALSAEYGQYACYICDVFGKFFVFSKAGKLWMQNYTASDTAATLEGEPVEVVRVVQYRSPDGSVIANSEREIDMNKLQMVAALIASAAFIEADRNFLMGKSDEQLKLLHDKIENKAEPVEVSTPAANASKGKKGSTVLASNGSAKEVPPEPLAENEEPSPEDYIAKAPKKIAAMLGNGLRAYEAQRARLIESIVKHSKFKKEMLENKENDELEILAESLVPKGEVGDSPSYLGLADAFHPSRNSLGSPASKDLQSEGLAANQWEQDQWVGTGKMKRPSSK